MSGGDVFLGALAGAPAILVDFGSRGFLLLLLVLGLGLALRDRPAARHRLYATALVVLLFLPIAVAASPWRLDLPSATSALLVPASRQAIEADARPEPSAAPRESTAGLRPTATDDGACHGEATCRANRSRGISELDSAAGSAAQVPERRARVAVDSAPSRSGIAAMLAGAWAVGVLLLLGRIGTGALVLALRTRRASPLTDPRWRSAARRACGRLELRRAVRLAVTDAIAGPLVRGFFRPVVVLPVAARGWSTSRIDAVLLHELAHVRRGDPIWLALARLGAAFHWPNPLAWIAWREARRTAETTCDLEAIRAGIGRREYARHLVAIVREHRGSRPRAALGMARISEVRWRVERVLRAPPNRAGRASGIASLAGAVALAGPVAAVSPSAPATVASASAPSAADSSPAPTVDASPPASATADPPGTAGPERTPRTAGPERTLRTAGEDTWPTVAPEDRVVAALIGALGDPDPSVRRSALNSLRDIGDPRGLAAIERLLSDPDPDVRTAAEAVLGLRPASPNLALPPGRPRQPVDPDVLAARVDALANPDPDVRLRAARALGNLADPRSARALTRALADSDVDVRQAAADAIGNLPRHGIVEPLAQAMRDPHPRVRRSAASALGRSGDPGAAGALAAGSADPDADVRQAAVSALGDLGARDRTETVVAALSDEDPHVRGVAAEALGRLAAGP